MKKNILVIDDQIFLQRLIVAALAKIDCVYHSALNGNEGKKKIAEIKPDLIILDIMLPDVSGIDLLKQLSADKIIEKIPVIMLSGKGDDESIKTAYALGAARFMKKPFNPKELIQIVKGVFAEKEILNEDDEEKALEILDKIRLENFELSVAAYKKLIAVFHKSRKILTALVHLIGTNKVFELKNTVLNLLKNSGIQSVREKCVWTLGQLLDNNMHYNDVSNQKIVDLIYSIAENESESIELRIIACASLKQMGLEVAVNKLFEELNNKYYAMF